MWINQAVREYRWAACTTSEDGRTMTEAAKQLLMIGQADRVQTDYNRYNGKFRNEGARPMVPLK
ncbi:hypothetical protein ACFFK0_04585 [Paenibacillus chartarius]|uniref:Uncharacterized protein n=1 Tax=Paenibacillus chartarius TaxID=747481 RepID=A0ABV6DGG4_9BACL